MLTYGVLCWEFFFISVDRNILLNWFLLAYKHKSLFQLNFECFKKSPLLYSRFDKWFKNPILTKIKYCSFNFCFKKGEWNLNFNTIWTFKFFWNKVSLFIEFFYFHFFLLNYPLKLIFQFTENNEIRIQFIKIQISKHGEWIFVFIQIDFLSRYGCRILSSKECFQNEMEENNNKTLH